MSEKKYKAIEPFSDTRDSGWEYGTGDRYPRPGSTVPVDRIKELAGSSNRLGRPVIERDNSGGGGGGGDLPEVTAADNGKALAVVDGAWDTQDTLEVVFVMGDLSLTCNKTLAEINAALNSGNDVRYKLTYEEETHNAFLIDYKDEGEYKSIHAGFLLSVDADDGTTFITIDFTGSGLSCGVASDALLFLDRSPVIKFTMRNNNTYTCNHPYSDVAYMLDSTRCNMRAIAETQTGEHCFDMLCEGITDEGVVFGGSFYDADELRVYREVTLHSNESVDYADYTATLTPVSP